MDDTLEVVEAEIVDTYDQPETDKFATVSVAIVGIAVAVWAYNTLVDIVLFFAGRL